MLRLTLARLAGTTGIALTLAMPALAQQAAPAANEIVTLEEIIVTAQRRPTSAQDTPISLTAISGSTLADSGVKRVEDIANMLPNVYIDNRNLRGQNIAIRGISADLNNPGLDQGVGIFIDGVYMGRATATNQNLFDLERIEVLRGPQGTLYGKNAIAGAINYVTRLPGDETYAEGTIGYGNFDSVTGSLLLSAPLVDDKLSASIGGSIDQQRGLIFNSLTGRHIDNRNGQNARAVIRARPTEDLDIILRGDISRDRTRSGAIEVVNDGAMTGTPLDQPDPRTRTVAQNRDPQSDRDAGGLSAEINLKTEAGTLTSLSAWRYSDWYNLGENDYTPLDILASGIREDQKQLSQELRFASSGSGPFDYVLGLYYFHQDLDTQARSIAGPDLGVYPYEVDGSIFADVVTNSYAAFSHGTYRLTEQVSLSGGLRFTKEDKTVKHRQQGDPLQLLLPNIPLRKISRSETNISPSISLNYKPEDNMFFYLTFSQGYKSGGFNVFSISPTDDAEYEPEHVNNYEAGVKTTFLDRRLQIDASVYHLDYRRLQASQLLLINNLAVFQTSNAAKARSRGAEISVAARPVRELTLSATYGYVDATFPEYPNATSTGADYSGHRLPRAPRHNASAAAQYEVPVGGDLELFARAELSHRTKIFFAADNIHGQDAVTLLNARVGIQEYSKGDWGVYLWGRNLTNVDYVIYKEAGAIIPGQVIQSIAAPRTYGIELRGRF